MLGLLVPGLHMGAGNFTTPSTNLSGYLPLLGAGS